jgi:hypothetical protein
MPLDDGCRLDQHHGVEDLGSDSGKPHPEQPVGGEEPRAARALPMQNSHLVSQSNEFKFQRCTGAHPEREQGTDSGQKCDHADDIWARHKKRYTWSAVSTFAQAQAHPLVDVTQRCFGSSSVGSGWSVA